MVAIEAAGTLAAVGVAAAVETAAEASRLGASGYIVKPFKSEEILETVRKNLKSNYFSDVT